MLIVFSEALVAVTPMIAAEKDINLEEPVVSKDVDGEENKEVIKG